MSGAVRVVVTGAEEVARRFAALARDIDDLQSVYAAVAQRIAAEERSFAPKRTGRLAAGVVGSATRRAGGVTVVGVPYAGVINFGWQARGIAAAYFAQRAADNKGPATADAIGRELQHDIDKEGLG